MSSRETLEVRLQRLEDRQEIADLAARYALAIDDRNLDALESLYTHDAVYENADGVHDGRDAILAYLLRRQGVARMSVHSQHTHVVEFTGSNQAQGTVTAHAELDVNGELFITALRYTDRYARTAAGWRFRSRSLEQVYSMPLRDFVEGIPTGNRHRWPTETSRGRTGPDGGHPYTHPR